MTDTSIRNVGGKPDGGGVQEWHGPHGARGSVWPSLRSTRVLLDLFLVIEVGIVHLCGLTAAALYVGGRLGVENYYGNYAASFLMLPLMFGLLLKAKGYYEVAAVRDFSGSLGGVLANLSGAFALLVVVNFALGSANDYSRVWYLLWLATAIPATITSRALASHLLDQAARRGLVRRRAVIWGEPDRVHSTAAALALSCPEIEILRTFEVHDRDGYSAPGTNMDSLAQLISFGQENDLDLVIVAQDSIDQDAEHALAAMRVLPVEICLKLGGPHHHLLVRAVSSLGGMQLLVLQRRPISDWNMVLKAVEDYSLAAVGVVLLSPLLLLLAIIIKLDSSGPVFFRQQRNGFNQRVFSVWKFRTMSVLEDGDAFVQARPGDVRVTRFGRFLRRTSLDELPQLFNVLNGDMSIVGPRPHPLALNGQYMEVLESYGSRHKVKPGITGWAQINGLRGPTAEPELMLRRVAYDLEYINNWSIWLDLKIIAATPFLGLAHKNAL